MIKKSKKQTRRKKQSLRKENNIESSVTFLWNKNKIIPSVIPTNLDAQKINDVFAMTAEQLLVLNPEYFPVLMNQVKQIYDFMYNNNASNIN